MELRDLAVFAVLLLFSCWAGVSAETAPTSCEVKSNTSCEECLSNVTCLWCNTNRRCVDYPVRNILPPSSLCGLSDARWGKCWVNFLALIITLSVVGGVIIIAVLVCCFRCCRCENIGSRREEERMQRQADLRRVKKEERRAEMDSRHNEIRMKYGLMKGNPYTRFENN